MSRSLTVRVALVAFVLAWIFVEQLRSTVPIWVVFVIALGLELQFLFSALRASPARLPDRQPQEVDRDRYGFEREPDEIVVVQEGGTDVWLALSEEPDEEEEDEDEPDEEGTSTTSTSRSLPRGSLPFAASSSASA